MRVWLVVVLGFPPRRAYPARCAKGERPYPCSLRPSLKVPAYVRDDGPRARSLTSPRPPPEGGR